MSVIDWSEAFHWIGNVSKQALPVRLTLTMIDSPEYVL